MSYLQNKYFFKYLLTTFTIIFLISCSGPTFDERVSEIENGEVWDGYNPDRLDKCRVRKDGIFLSDTTSDCSLLDREELYESHKDKYIVFKGFSLDNYDENLIPQEDGGYLYKNIFFVPGDNSETTIGKTPDDYERDIKVEYLYVKDKKMVDFLYKESQKEQGYVSFGESYPHDPRITLTIKGLIKEVNPVCTNWNKEICRDNEELRLTVMKRGIIIDPVFE